MPITLLSRWVFIDELIMARLTIIESHVSMKKLISVRFFMQLLILVSLLNINFNILLHRRYEPIIPISCNIFYKYYIFFTAYILFYRFSRIPKRMDGSTTFHLSSTSKATPLLRFYRLWVPLSIIFDRIIIIVSHFLAFPSFCCNSIIKLND